MRNEPWSGSPRRCSDRIALYRWLWRSLPVASSMSETVLTNWVRALGPTKGSVLEKSIRSDLEEDPAPMACRGRCARAGALEARRNGRNRSMAILKRHRQGGRRPKSSWGLGRASGERRRIQFGSSVKRWHRSCHDQGGSGRIRETKGWCSLRLDGMFGVLARRTSEALLRSRSTDLGYPAFRAVHTICGQSASIARLGITGCPSFGGS